MIKILKASAGSGKTFHLAKTYIRLLLQEPDPHAYRHILAVTFTNKATDEMKSRILKELHKLSKYPGKSSYTKDFVPSLFPSQEELKEKAGDVLVRILHDYGAFSVSTIDRFFQQTLKAFSREIGQFASYQVELDKKSLVKESVDRILDSVSEDNRTLLDWLSASMMDQLEQNGSMNLEKSLNDMALKLKSDEHREVAEKNKVDPTEAYSKANLSRMKGLLRKVMSAYVKEVRESIRALVDALASCGLTPYDTSSHFMEKGLAKFRGFDVYAKLPEMTAAFRKDLLDYDSWFKKKDKPKYAGQESTLAPVAARFVAAYEKGMKTYNTAKILSGQVNDLGIASELEREFRELMKEKNVLSLDDSNVILKHIIDGTDAPFIYEKLGGRLEHFLLDEFQDTSGVQWENFKPLIANSDSEGLENLIVGDVKQSIYRWRGSDWKLMAERVGAQFPEAEGDSLKGNWRSLRNIVDFNNSFFYFASGRLDKEYGCSGGLSAASIYGSDLPREEGYQKVMTDDTAPGSVEAVFCDSSEQNRIILETIDKVLAAGAKPGDITVLVRKNDIGSEIASFLMENGKDVISDDSLDVKSSSVVRKLVSLLSSIRNPEDTIGSYLAVQEGLDVLGTTYHSIPDLCEQLLRLISSRDTSGAFGDESLYIQSFMDYVKDYSETNGNSLDAFLKAWETADLQISSPADADAIRIMTIHKAKGLEFPYVILPYSEKVELFRQKESWVVPRVDGTSLEGLGKAAFNVTLSSTSANTFFDKEYEEELLLQHIDNINTYYVALTRAVKGMTIISDISSKPDKNFAGILLSYFESEGEKEGFSREDDGQEDMVVFRKGDLYDFSKLEREKGNVSRISIGYPSFPLNPEPEEGSESVERGRLRVSADSSDFFTEEGKARMEARQNGTVMHDILSRVRIPSDLDASVRQAVRQGDLDTGKETWTRDFLAGRIDAHPEWFPGEGAEVLNEVSLIDVDGKEWRPDRVIIKDGAVTVVDYKFGERNPRYRAQVARYAGIYRRLGYQQVSTALWYVTEDSVD